MKKLSVACLLFLAVSAAFAQVSATPESVSASGVRYQVAHTPEDAVSAAVATVISNPEVCCGRNSSLEDAVATADHNLQQIANKLQGRHVLPDGRPYVMSATFYPTRPSDGSPAAANVLLTALRGNHPLLMLWQSNLYVVYAANYTETIYNGEGGTSIVDTVETLQLFDPATGRRTTFERTKDNWDDVQGLVTLTLGPSSS